jgi:uncharacterized lipoprotein YbaY
MRSGEAPLRIVQQPPRLRPDMQLRGEIHFPEVASSVAGATLRVRLLDVSRADASAETIAANVVEDVSVVAADQRIAFVLDIGDLDPRHTYTLEAHLDIDGSGVVERGDYRTMEHFDVSPATVDRGHVVTCRPIG